jgi:hypothetical protein
MTLLPKSNRSARLLQILVIFGILTFAVPLIGYMINGSAMRFSGDDYCYADVLGKLGFWKTQWLSYLQTQPYNGNRYSLTLFASISGLFGPVMNGVLPGLVIVVWLVGMIYAIRNIAPIKRASVTLIEALLLSEIIIFFTLYTAPSLAQILYWRSGMLPYLAPLVANTYLIGLIFKLAQKRIVGLWGFIGVGILALLAGGFSEAAAVFQAGFLAFMLIGVLLIANKTVESKRNLILAVSAALGSSLLACLLLALSPANAAYMSKIAKPDIISILGISINSGVSFIKGSLTSTPLPIFVLFIFFCAASWLFYPRVEGSLSFSVLKWLRNVVLVILIGTLLIIASSAPSAYIQSAYPESRTLIIAQFVIILAMASLGSLVGFLVSHLVVHYSGRLPNLRFAVVALLGILCFYPIYSARNIYVQTPMYQRWALYWDARDLEIRSAKQDGTVNVEVMEIDHIIPSVSELDEDASFWYNVCAAGYYDVQTIRADKPGWDTP